MAKKVVLVETKSRDDMQAFFCIPCDKLFEHNPFWPISTSLSLHLRGTGHEPILLLKYEVVEDEG